MKFIKMHGCQPTSDPRVFVDGLTGKFSAFPAPDDTTFPKGSLDHRAWQDESLEGVVAAIEVLEKTGTWPDGKKPF